MIFGESETVGALPEESRFGTAIYETGVVGAPLELELTIGFVGSKFTSACLAPPLPPLPTNRPPLPPGLGIASGEPALPCIMATGLGTALVG